jgi:hypothetical protein
MMYLSVCASSSAINASGVDLVFSVFWCTMRRIRHLFNMFGASGVELLLLLFIYIYIYIYVFSCLVFCLHVLCIRRRFRHVSHVCCIMYFAL